MDISLLSAVKSNDLESAVLILQERTIDIYLKDEKGLTALDILIQKKIEMFNALHEKQNEEFSDFKLNRTERKALDAADAKKERHPKEYLYSYRELEDESREQFQNEKKIQLNVIRRKIEKNDKFIHMLLKYRGIELNCTKVTRLLKFHAACTLRNVCIADKMSNQVSDIMQSTRENPPIYPGYTALHIAAHCNVNMVKMLVMKGAYLMVQDEKGTTPFDICIKSFNIDEILSILHLISSVKNNLFSDGKTKLLDYISSLSDRDNHKNFIRQIAKDIGVSLFKESFLWPGYTILHVAIRFVPEANREMINDILFLNKKLVTAQDIYGATPVHLAFYQNKLKVLEILLNHHEKSVNPIDMNGLSHLHIAASVNHQKVIKHIFDIFERKISNLDAVYRGKHLATVKLGWTPLHTAVYTNHMSVARLLLKQGADLLATDYRGFTAIHLLPTLTYTEKLAKVLFAANQLKECVNENTSLTHLHVAVWKNQVTAIERLLDSGGSKIEATIGNLNDGKLKHCKGFRAIHLAMMNRWSTDTFTVLLKRGASILAEKPDGSTPLHEILTQRGGDFLTSFVKVLWSSEQLQNQIEQLGMTMLHIACYIYDEEKVNELLEKEVDVNAKVRDDSRLWPGCTPLHVLASSHCKDRDDEYTPQIFDKLCDLLLKKKADITLTDKAGDTPVLMALKEQILLISDQPVVIACKDKGISRARFLIKHLDKFDVNPKNKFGMSHFHVSCFLNEVDIAKELLKNTRGIDVNQPISSTNSRFAGHTPLHMALSSTSSDDSQIQMVKLLLEHGADVHATDTFGWTPLHKLAACTYTRRHLLNKILIDSTDINKRTVSGKTPLEILLRDGASCEELKYFVELGARLNSYNPISDVGYMAIVINSDKYKKTLDANNQILTMMMNLPDITEVDDTGRNAIHNAVAAESTNGDVYRNLNTIEKLVQLGCNIFQQDNQGRTALHLAVKFQNKEAVEELLRSGADVNVTDSTGKSPFSYASEFRKDERPCVHRDANINVRKVLAKHLRELQILGLQVSELNANLLTIVLEKREDADILVSEYIIKQQLKLTAKKKFDGCDFTLRDFLYQTSLLNMYSLSNKVRDSIDKFFQTDNLEQFPNLKSFINLQYRNAMERKSLFLPAVDALKKISGYWVPNLCVEIILVNLTNFDIKNMSAAANLADHTNMDID